jgi:hypothetical protein
LLGRHWQARTSAAKNRDSDLNLKEEPAVVVGYPGLQALSLHWQSRSLRLALLDQVDIVDSEVKFGQKSRSDLTQQPELPQLNAGLTGT